MYLPTLAKRLSGRLFDILLPPLCPLCGLDVARPGACRSCLLHLPWNRLACRRCAKPVATEDTLCAVCQRRPPPFVRAIAPLRYEFPADGALKALKFRARSYYLPWLGSLLCDAADELPGDIDGILAMPMHWRRWALRGFNQALELARPVARHLDLPIVDGVTRIRHTAFQSGLDARSRRTNLAGAFRVTTVPGGRHILIIDDVMTTGQSCRSLAQALRVGGVTKVSVLVVARAGGSTATPQGARL